MKKLILFAAILFSVSGIVKAQDVTNSADTKVSIMLKPIQTLFINPAQIDEVELVYSDIKDYKKGVSSKKKNHLTVYSTGAFIVQVNSKDNTLKSTQGKGEISASTISVQALKGTSNALENASLEKVSLSTTPTNLINSGTGGVEKNFDIIYAGMGGNEYVNKYFKDEGNQTIYVTTVTYTIAAQ